jgi:hypothetical protein
MTVAIASMSTVVKSAMASIETSLTNTSSIDTLAMVFAAFITGLYITSGALPSREARAGRAQTSAIGSTVKATNSWDGN